MPKSKRPRKPFLGNKFRIHSLEAKLLTAQLGKNMQTTLAWVLALDQRLRALEPQPAADAPATSSETDPTPQGEATTPPTAAPIAPQEEPGNE